MARWIVTCKHMEGLRPVILEYAFEGIPEHTLNHEAIALFDKEMRTNGMLPTLDGITYEESDREPIGPAWRTCQHDWYLDPKWPYDYKCRKGCGSLKKATNARRW